MPWLRTGELEAEGTLEEATALRLPPFGPQARPLLSAGGTGIPAPPPQQRRAERPAAAGPGCRSRLRQRPGSLTSPTSSCRTWGPPALRGPRSSLIQRQNIAGGYVAGSRRPCRKPGRSISCFRRVLAMTAWRRSSPCWEFPSLLRRPFLFMVGLSLCLQFLMCSSEWWVAVAGAWREVVSLSLVCTKLCLGFCICIHL